MECYCTGRLRRFSPVVQVALTSEIYYSLQDLSFRRQSERHITS